VPCWLNSLLHPRREQVRAAHVVARVAPAVVVDRRLARVALASVVDQRQVVEAPRDAFLFSSRKNGRTPPARNRL
jgi:hypothetical protein